MHAHVLVVDDDYHARLILATHIRRMGCEVYEAQNGQDALEIALGMPSRPARPVDIVITDVWMPGLSGIDLLKALHERFPDMPIAMISARATLTSSLEAINAGAYAYLTKPFKGEEVQRVVARGLQRVEELRLRQELMQYSSRLADLEGHLATLQRQPAPHPQVQPDEDVVTDLITGLRHELGNMATAIKLNLEVIRERRNVPEDLRENLADLQASADDLVALLSRFKEYPQPGKITQLTDLREIVAGAVDMARTREPSERVSIDLDIRDANVLVYAAAPELSRAILHLLENAVEASNQSSGRVAVTLAAVENDALLTIDDDGPGFPGEVLDATFSPSYTTKIENGFVRGLGLGLFITRTVISLHRGHINLENRPEGGARVKITLPVAQLDGTAA